jgi:Mlc titration factor MtfA (ptsG expression regulator)
VVIHEFAHQLDFTDGISLGTPPLGNRELEARWQCVMTVKFEDHRRAIAMKRPTPLFTSHSADNEAEYFASASEAFFCRPIHLKRLHPEVYELLAAYYRVDPIVWFTGSR